MKRLFFIQLLFSFSLAVFSQQSYTIKFNKNDFNYNITNGILKISSSNPKALFTDDYSAPALPYFSYRILRPIGTDSIRYHIDYKTETIYTDLHIESNPYILSTDTIIDNKAIEIATKSVSSPVLYSGNFLKYGYEYTFFKITPFLYDVDKRQLSFISEIVITYPNSDISSTRQEEYDDNKKEYIKTIVLNREEVDMLYPTKINKEQIKKEELRNTYHGMNNGTWDYIIITSDSLAPAFQELINWKIRKGLRAKVFTLDYIYNITSFYSGSNQEKIRFWIDYMHTYYNVKWVLLGGDATIVPVQYCQAKYGLETENVPSDLYYATYSMYSPKWDNNGNGIIGEMGDLTDFSPLVYLTRAPVRNSNDVSYFTQKILRYEKGGNLFNPSYVSTMLYAGKELGNPAGSYSTCALCDSAYNTYIDNYWLGSRDYLYSTYNGTMTNLTNYNTLTPGNLYGLINNNYHFIHMDCHGSASGWSLVNGTFDTGYASTCHNDNRTIFLTTSCLSNQFDYNSTLSKSFLNSPHGAIAFFASSRDGLYYTNNNFGQSLLYNTYFFYYLLNSEPTDAPHHFGSVAAYSKMEFADDAISSETDGFRYLQLAICPMGDPEMPIYTSNPQYITGVQVSFGNNGDVTVSTGGLSGCTIALTSIDGGTSYFEVVENVNSYTFHDVLTRFYVTVSKHNYLPYISGTFFPGIAGDSHLWEGNYYNIDVPQGYTVDWSFANQNPSNNAYLYSINEHMCVFMNPNEEYVNDTIIASIKYYNTVVATRYIKVSTGKGFSMTMHNQGYTNGNSIYPTYTANVGDGTHMGVYENCDITLTSPDLADAVFSFSGYNPTSFTKNPDGTITTIFPSVPGNNVEAVVITGKNLTTEKIFQFTFHIQHAVIQNSSNLSLNVNTNREHLDISIENQQKSETNMTTPKVWTLSITNAQNGQIVYDSTINNNNKASVSTFGWKSGVYVIKGIIGEEMITKKIYVK